MCIFCGSSLLLSSPSSLGSIRSLKVVIVCCVQAGVTAVIAAPDGGEAVAFSLPMVTTPPPTPSDVDDAASNVYEQKNQNLLEYMANY